MNTQLKQDGVVGTIENGTSKRFARWSMTGAALAVLIVAALAMSQTLIHRAPASVAHSGPTARQIQFLEANTTFLPASVMPDVAPIRVSSDRARFLEVNTNLGMVDAPVAPASSAQQRFIEVNTFLGTIAATGSAQQRFIEVNTNLGMVADPTAPSYPYSEDVTPVRGPR